MQEINKLKKSGKKLIVKTEASVSTERVTAEKEEN